ncbi:LINE-1 reverse transcriptase-like [Vitis vinifera]|uniref:LINE-1 reverse transcriptase-like n=1 Tax=Vitis vinifera TaxID=29760 RepID=A0A438DN39_VITVI|nr:LINE-1 reverse transcriptase-like [Vitis vinifera]
MERSKTDHALIEEAMRYGNVLDSWEKRASGSSPSLSFPFGRTPLREYYEFSGAVCEAVQGEILLCMVTTPGITEGASTTCWDLIEVNNGSNKERRVELCSAQSEPQEDRGWEENSWEDSSLARFRNMEDGFVWMFTGVYGFTREERECLERSKQGKLTTAARRFAQIVDELGLVDLPLQGALLTWNGGGGLRRGPSPFRFENMWLKVEGFKDLLRSWWQGIVVRDSASFRLATKLKEDVREGIANAFHQLVSEDSDWKADIEGLLLEHLSIQEAESLELAFFEEEIYFAFMEMNCDKAPGLNEFTVAFWKTCWDFVKEKILELFKEFYDQSFFAKSLNTTFLVLIPKKGGVEDLRDFRPISLLGGLYKLLAKVLANRLKKVIGKVVSLDQNAFVMGRQILDASLIAMSINWHFLMRIMQKMGWMWRCISTAKFSVLVSGVLTGFFSSSKGLRQGDPLSPCLFVMGMEVLSVLIRKVVDGGFLSGCRIRGRGRTMNISHLLFADDTVVFFGEVEEVEELAVELGYTMGSLPSSYLGLPLGVAHHKALSMWDGVEERVRRRLALWKRQYISKGRRITLIKSMLASMPLYQPFAPKKENLWKKVILVKYGQEGLGWRTNEANGTFGVGVWKEILKETNWCWENIEFKVGKGTKVKFWLIAGVALQRCPKAFPNYTPWLSIGMQRWTKCGLRILAKEANFRGGFSYLEGWRKWKIWVLRKRTTC